MIADWTVEVGTQSPSIDVPWNGWVDLRWEGRSAAILELVEAQTYPELRHLLETLNGQDLFTSKVDVFPVSREEVDPEIAEAGIQQTAFGVGSYVDVLAQQADIFSGFARFESVARLVAAKLSKMEVPSLCVAEVVIRPAHLFGAETFGWTLYAMGFGSTEAEARTNWGAAAAALTTQMVAQVRALAAGGRTARCSRTG